MTLTQLEYFVAVDTHRHFAKAAAACFVTQPTLSMQLKKLEEELGVTLFDRNKHPVEPTDDALQLLPMAKEMLSWGQKMKEAIVKSDEEPRGTIRLGIIPTLAPYVLPMVLPSFGKKYPKIRLEIRELTTAQLLEALRLGSLDAGLAATPLNAKGYIEKPLFYEPFVAYLSADNPLRKKKNLSVQEINPDELWLLDEGHCFRDQVLNLCSKQSGKSMHSNISLKAGSIETLRALVEQDAGATLLPELATLHFQPRQRSSLRFFRSPEPVREVSLVTRKGAAVPGILGLLEVCIRNAVPERYHNADPARVVPL